MKWISVKDRLPGDELVLICLDMCVKPLIITAWHHGDGRWDVVDVLISAITHWMPLPESPYDKV